MQLSWLEASPLMLLSSASALCACSTPPLLPGDQLGTFDMVGTLGDNGCGAGVMAAPTFDSGVEFSKIESYAYMVSTDGTGEVSGTFASTTATILSSRTVSAGGDAGALCSLTAASAYTVTFDSTRSPMSFTGTLSYTYSVAAGVSTPAECAGELASGGGSWTTLPCTVTYSLAGTRR